MFRFFRFGWSRRDRQEHQDRRRQIETAGARFRDREWQAQRIRLALSSVLQRRGIGSQSIGCELSPMVRPGAPDLILAQLVILQWHDGLMRLAPQLEKELFEEIRLLDPGAVASNFFFAWKFALGNDHARGRVPASNSRAQPPQVSAVRPRPATAPSLAATARSAPKVKFDLPKSAFDRDDNDQDYDGFAATLIASR